jgi:hypothetical protein
MNNVAATSPQNQPAPVIRAPQEFGKHAAAKICEITNDFSGRWGGRIRTSDWLIQNSPGSKPPQTSVLIASEHRVEKWDGGQVVS